MTFVVCKRLYEKYLCRLKLLNFGSKRFHETRLTCVLVVSFDFKALKASEWWVKTFCEQVGFPPYATLMWKTGLPKGWAILSDRSISHTITYNLLQRRLCLIICI